MVDQPRKMMVGIKNLHEMHPVLSSSYTLTVVSWRLSIRPRTYKKTNVTKINQRTREIECISSMNDVNLRSSRFDAQDFFLL